MQDIRCVHFHPTCERHLENFIKSMILEGWALFGSFQEYLLFTRDTPRPTRQKSSQMNLPLDGVSPESEGEDPHDPADR